MEIYDHQSLSAVKTPPSDERNGRKNVVALSLSVAALVTAVLSLILCVCLRPKTKRAPSFASAYAAVRPSCAEVYCGSARGSGVVTEIRGGKTYVVTNYHVVADGGAQVRFAEFGERYDALLAGYDAYHDIALLCVDGSFGTPCAWGMRVAAGEEVLAVGNNLGYGIAAYDGIVSHTNRLLKASGESKCVPVYAVTAPVNAGMSGGGLFTLSGKLVGINTYQTVTVEGGTRPVDGVSYTVPANIVQKIVRRILSDGQSWQDKKIDVRGSMTQDKTIDFVGLYFTASATQEGFVVTQTFADGVTEWEGQTPQAGDVLRKIGVFSVGADDGYADIFAACLAYEHDTAATGETLVLTFDRDGDTVKVTYTQKHKSRALR